MIKIKKVLFFLFLMTFFHSSLYASFHEDAISLNKNIDDLLSLIKNNYTINRLPKTNFKKLEIRNSCFNIMIGLNKILDPAIKKDLSANAIYNSLVQDVLKLDKVKLVLIQKSINIINQYYFPDENLSNLLINHFANNCFSKDELFKIVANDNNMHTIDSSLNSYSKLLSKRGIYFQSKEKRIFVEDMNKSLLDSGAANNVYLANCNGSDCILRIPKDTFSKQYQNEIFKEIVLKERLKEFPKLLNYFVVYNTLFGEEGQNINQLGDFLQNEVVFGTYPLMSGGNLDFYIRKNPANISLFSKNKLFSIAQQLISGLVVLHEAKLAHRDIKPQNILFEDKTFSKVKYIDFGEMFLDDDNSRSEIVCGTAYYQPPELFFKYEGYQYNLELAQKHDVYSLGMVLYQLTFGQLPNHITEVPFMFKIGKAHFDFYTNLDPIYQIEKISQVESMKDLIYWSINPDPQKRPTAELLLAGLNKIKHRFLKFQKSSNKLAINFLNFDKIRPSDQNKSPRPMPFRQFDEKYKDVVKELKRRHPHFAKSRSVSNSLQDTTKTEVRRLGPVPFFVKKSESVPQKLFMERELSSEKSLTLIEELEIVLKERRKSLRY